MVLIKPPYAPHTHCLTGLDTPFLHVSNFFLHVSNFLHISNYFILLHYDNCNGDRCGFSTGGFLSKENKWENRGNYKGIYPLTITNFYVTVSKISKGIYFPVRSIW